MREKGGKRRVKRGGERKMDKWSKIKKDRCRDKNATHLPAKSSIETAPDYYVQQRHVYSILTLCGHGMVRSTPSASLLLCILVFLQGKSKSEASDGTKAEETVSDKSVPGNTVHHGNRAELNI